MKQLVIVKIRLGIVLSLISQIGILESSFAQQSVQRPTIVNLDNSMVTGITCPLVDNLPRQDLLSAAENLSRNIESLKRCQDGDQKDLSNTSSVESMQAHITTIANAGKNLKDFFQNPEVVAADKSKFKDIEIEVENMIRGIDQVSKNLMRNPLMSGECAQGMMRTTDMIVSLSDLAQSATPYAMMALQANPAFAPAIPYVIGLSAAGNVANVIKRFSDESSLDMTDEKTRLAVLQNICEYTRIVQRVRGFNVAKRDALQTISQQIASYNAFSRTLFKKYSAYAQAAVQEGMKVKADLEAIKKSSLTDQANIVQVYNTVKDEKDPRLACFQGRVIVKEADNSKELTARVIANMQQALSKGSFFSDAAKSTYVALMLAEDSLRKKIIREMDNDSEAALMVCAKDAKSYLETLNRLIVSTQNLANSAQNQVDQNLQKSPDPGVSQLAKGQQDVETEKQKLEILMQARANELKAGNGEPGTQAPAPTPATPVKATDALKLNPNIILGSQIKNSKDKSTRSLQEQILASQNSDNGAGVNAEINRNLIDVKLALFGRRDGWAGTPILRPFSPAYSWYRDADLYVRKNVTDFQNEVSALREQMKGFDRAVWAQNAAAKTFSPLTLQLLEQGSAAHRKMCSRLNNMMDMWQGAIDHLTSMISFCSYIDDYQDKTFDPNIKGACEGKESVTGVIALKIHRSELGKLNADLAPTAHDADLILNKSRELMCNQ